MTDPRNKLLEDILAAIQSGGGVLPADNCRIGWADYNDAETAVTPIQVLAGVPKQITNDTLGPQTSRAFLPSGVTDIWDPVADQFDFSELRNGDLVDIRFDAEITTTTPNQLFRLAFVGGIGGFQYEVVMSSGVAKNTGLVPVSRFNSVYIGDDNTRLNPAELRLTSDADATVVVKGWYCKILMRG